ncbi:hypothetical protein BU035_10055 [Staphylococcus simulans]|uniref:hypothetical protein n=1 Tax=Staphylococcus simulans TaxID=1286 RepID=UPI000D1E9E23|nr:hypothetical protein [Staphylococcus simulans]PTJ26013.1 hypothetical protein BU035_10055 [Staphylococcus simulans]
MINKATINKARTFEKKLGKQKWDKLKSLLLQTRHDVVKNGENELFLKIPGEKRADIEIFPKYNVHTWDQSFVHVQLWFYDFKTTRFQEEFNKNEEREHNNTVEAMNHINFILDIIREEKKLYKMMGDTND